MSGIEQRIAFGLGHEALSRECNRAQPVIEPPHRCEC
jgi:hypothetical protein